MPDSPLVETADNLREALRAASTEIETARRLPASLVGTLADAGFFRMLLPARYGGLEVSPATMLAVIASIARGDAAAGWCVMVGATSGMAAAWLGDEGEAHAIYGDPRAVTSGVFAPTAIGVRDGDAYRVTGRWAFASGVEHATHRLGGFVVQGEAGVREVRQALFRASDTQIHDTWDVMGLSGTGSHDMSVEDVLVPASRTVDIVARPHVDGALYAFPVFGLLALGVAAVAVGIAEAAIEHLVRLAVDKRPLGSSRSVAQRETVQADVGRADAIVSAARASLRCAAEDVHARAAAGEALRLEDKLRLRQSATYASHACAEAVTMMYKAGGGSAVYRKNPLQRALRDVLVATQHFMVHEQTLVLAGRAALGLEVDARML